MLLICRTLEDWQENACTRFPIPNFAVLLRLSPLPLEHFVENICRYYYHRPLRILFLLNMGSPAPFEQRPKTVRYFEYNVGTPTTDI